MPNFEFRWQCSYLNSVYFRAFADGASFEIELRHCLSDYEESIYNGGRAAYLAECGPLVAMLRAPHPIGLELVQAFNAWRVAEYERGLAQLRAAPEKYGPESDWAADIRPPPLANGCAWYDGDGRHVMRLPFMRMPPAPAGHHWWNAAPLGESPVWELRRGEVPDGNPNAELRIFGQPAREFLARQYR